MGSGATWEGFDLLQAELLRYENPNLEPLMEEIKDVLYDQNKISVLAGIDVDDQPMPITQRQLKVNESNARRATQGQGPRLFKQNRSPYGLVHDGPPLDPRYQESRIITNLAMTHHEEAPGEWWVIGAWDTVVSSKGVQFMPFHFRGEGKLPKRNRAGIDSEGLRRVYVALDNFIEKWLR